MRRVFKDISKLSPSYIPERIPHREVEFKNLVDLFKPVIEGSESYNHVFIIGEPGVGKTMLAKYFERYLGNVRDLIVIYTNYRVEKRSGNIVRAIVSNIIPSMPLRGYSIEEMFIAVMREAVNKKLKIILILDDADTLFRKEKEFIYLLSRVDEILSTQNILSLLFILHSEYVLLSLDAWTAGALRKNLLRLKEYSYNELIDILRERVEDAFNEGAVLDETIQTCADIASTYNCNARYAIDLLLKGGKLAEQFGSDSVKPEHIRLARDQVPPSFSTEDIKHLSQHEKLILYSLSRALLNSSKAFVSTGELEEEYKDICREVGLQPISHTWFWNEIKNLSYFGFISRRESGKGYRGRTTIIGLPSFSARFLEEILRKEVYRR
jgi:cell division control protein 6